MIIKKNTYKRSPARAIVDAATHPGEAICPGGTTRPGGVTCHGGTIHPDGITRPGGVLLAFKNSAGSSNGVALLAAKCQQLQFSPWLCAII